ncbi:MAG: T9SS type A sorting domain-containing protein, partial [Porphyromonadaceae bacterium]|nr:T9SS type A sorting domain-containing protein [Porphyromonadaceae bacterium]
VQGDTKVVATFRKKVYRVEVMKAENGSIELTGAGQLHAVSHGTELTVHVSPSTGYDLATLTANGVDIMAKRKFVVREATVVKATFSKRIYKITLDQTEGGTISIQGKSSGDLNAVEDGTELTLLVAPKEGYELERLTANGKDITESKRFRVETHTTVRATFRKKPVEIKRYPVTLEQGEGGRIRIKGMSPEDLKAVPEGTELTVSIAREAGYDLATLTANGVDIMATKRFIVRGNTIVKATFRKRLYAITLKQTEGGTIAIEGKDAEALKVVEDGATLKVLVTLQEGYELETLTVNGRDIADSRKFTVQGDAKVVATFRKKVYRVEVIKAENGSVTVTGSDELHAVPYGTELTVHVEPNKGYELAMLEANGVDIMASRKFTVKSATTVRATFRQKPAEAKRYAVTLEQGIGGLIRIKGMSPEDLKAVPEGTELTVSIAREAGYDLATLTANGVDIMATKRFIVRGNTVVKATFRKRTYAIVLDQTEGGTIAIEGKDTEALKAVEDGETLKVLVTQQAGYELERITANGKDITTSRTFVVEGTTTVHATFIKQKTYRVTYRVEGQGSIAFTGARDMEAVPYGTELRVHTANGTGYELSSLKANGVDIMQTKRITVKSNVEVIGVFSKKFFAVTLPMVEHATIRIKGALDLTKVAYGTELDLEITPEKGFVIEEVKINGKVVTAPYRFVVKGDVKIEVKMKQDTLVGVLEQPSLRIYPNPTSAYIMIEGAPLGEWLRIYTFEGVLVYETMVLETEEPLDVSSLKSGVYLLRVGSRSLPISVVH